MSKRTIMKTYRVERVRETAKMYELKSGGIVRSPESAEEIFREVFNTDAMTKEHLMLASLNTKNKVEALHIVHIGSLNASIVHPRDVMQLAVLDNAASIILAHNHPSGDPAPSNEDIQVTKRIKDAGKILGIELLDHIILGDFNKSVSLKEKGYI